VAKESDSWPAFEAAVAADDDSEITDGEVARGGVTVALRLGVLMSGGEWYNVFLRAEHLTVRRSDDRDITLEEFLALGNAYWEAFANRKSASGE
jgi:hypothetical protein